MALSTILIIILSEYATSVLAVAIKKYEIRPEINLSGDLQPNSATPSIPPERLIELYTKKTDKNLAKINRKILLMDQKLDAIDAKLETIINKLELIEKQNLCPKCSEKVRKSELNLLQNDLKRAKTVHQK